MGCREPAAVRRDPGLLRIRNRDGETVYQVLQFDRGHGQVPGVAGVVETLTPVLEPLTIAAWLTGANANLGDKPSTHSVPAPLTRC